MEIFELVLKSMSNFVIVGVLKYENIIFYGKFLSDIRSPSPPIAGTARIAHHILHAAHHTPYAYANTNLNQMV